MKLLNKVKISLLFAFFIIILFNIKAFAVTGVITEITVNLRKEPSTNGKKIMYVTQDDKVEVLEKVGEWYKIKAKGTTGYVFGEYVKVDDSKLKEKEETTEVEKNSKVEESSKKEETSKIEQSTEKQESQIEDVTTDGDLKLQITNKAQLRLIPNISSSVIYTAKKNISVTVIEQLDNWAYVLVDNVYGWVRADKIVEENTSQTNKVEEKNEESNKNTTATNKEKVAYIKYDTVNLRKKASKTATVLAKLKLNDKVTVVEEVDSTWSKVKADGKVGYISTELLADEKQKVVKKEENNTTSRDGESTSRDESSATKKEEITGVKKEDKETSKKKEEPKKETTNNKAETSKKEEANKVENNQKEETNKKETTKNEETSSDKTTTTSKTTGEDIVSYAKNYLGYKYVLGAASPKKGFDCSGLTYYVYKHFGYNISRTSKTQAKDGKEVARKDLKPGDLLIFKNQSLTAIGHVGIYIGNNKMIHSSEPGVGVVITDLDARGYNYNKRYVTARRIIN